MIDKTGESIIIEFTNQRRKIYENPLGVMTNSPPYDFHMPNICNYVQLSKYAHEGFVLGGSPFKPLGEGSGLLEMPGDLTPTSRLVRAATLADFATSVKTGAEAVNLAFHVLNSVDIPKGVACHEKQEHLADYTSWKVVKDLTNNALYYHDYNDLNIRVVYLDKVKTKKRLKIKVEAHEVRGFNDVTGDLTPTEATDTELLYGLQQHVLALNPNQKKLNELKNEPRHSKNVALISVTTSS